MIDNKKISLLGDIFTKTIACEISPTKAMSKDESYEWHKKHARIDPEDGHMIISYKEIGDGTFEKKYKHM